jgi:hypothetical protein
MQIIEQIIAGEKAISTSGLKEAKKSTRDFLEYYREDRVKDRKGYFDFGSACELYLIDKTEFNNNVFILDESKRPFPDKNYQTKANAEWKAGVLEANSDKLIIPAKGKDSFEVISEIEILAQKHPLYDLLFQKDMNYQGAFTWDCPISGFKRYSRPDLFSASKGVIVEIKTYDDEDFERACRNHDYFLAALDQIVGATASGKMQEVEEYYFCAISKKAPYFFDMYKFEFESALKVEEAYNRTLSRLKEDLNGDYSEIVWKDMPVTILKTPNYYK